MMARSRLTVVVPVFHNAPSLPELHCRLVALERSADVALEIIYVDDGSTDDSSRALADLADRDARVRVVRLARNFGSFIAIRAGLDHVADADCVAVLSADLQDPPELLGRMLAAWREGSQVVLAVRRRRDDPLLSRCFACTANWMLRKMALPDLPVGGFDFFLIDSKVLHVLRQFREHSTSLIGLLLWTGFRRALVSYDRLPRPFGRSMWRFARKVDYALDSLTGFSRAPLRAITLAGAAVLLLGLFLTAWSAASIIRGYASVSNWAWLANGLLVFWGAQLFSIGLLGEYLWHCLEESKARPLYVVASDTTRPQTSLPHSMASRDHPSAA